MRITAEFWQSIDTNSSLAQPVGKFKSFTLPHLRQILLICSAISVLTTVRIFCTAVSGPWISLFASFICLIVSSGYFRCVGNLITDFVDTIWQILCCSYFRWLALAHLCYHLHNRDWIFDQNTLYRADLLLLVHRRKWKEIRRCACSWRCFPARQLLVRPRATAAHHGTQECHRCRRDQSHLLLRQKCLGPNVSNNPLDQ